MAERVKGNKKKAAAKKTPMKGDKAAKNPRAKKGDNVKVFHAVPDEVIERHINAMRSKLRAMDKIQVELDEARGVYRNARKIAKKEGVNLDAFDIIQRLEKQDQGKVQVDHADAGRYLRIMESPLATQLELFQNMEAPAPEVDARLQGRQAGRNAEDATNNPFTPGTEQFVAWAEGWAEGQNDNAGSFKAAQGSAALN